jgi:hypothetical protein
MKVIFFVPVMVLLFSLTVYAQNNSLDLDGINDYVTMGDVLDMGTSDFTVEAWIYIEGTASPNKIVNKGLTNSGTPQNAGYGLRTSFSTARNIDFIIGDSDGSLARIESEELVVNTWQHIVGVREGRDVRLFVNGEVVANTTTTSVYNVDTNIPFAIGVLDRGNFEAPSEMTDGKIDEVRIWNTARSQAEIVENMNIELNGDESGLAAYYSFNQGVAGGNNSGETTLFDNTVNGNNGTLENFALNGNNSNWVGENAPLPIEMSYFRGSVEKNHIQLTWESINEVSSSNFEVQKSVNGVNWEPIDFVLTHGETNISTTYEYRDLAPNEGLNYYRLKLNDLDGYYAYSAVISLYYGDLVKNISISPNPFFELIKIKGKNPSGEKIKIRVFNSLGKEVSRDELIVTEGDWETILTLKEAGAYFVVVKIGKQIYQEQIVKSGRR